MFTPIDLLQYAGFSLNLAAGLEDALINRFDPPWNGRSHGRSISESAEIETSVISAPEEASKKTKETSEFQIKLKTTYYQQGIINPGTEASRLLGLHDESLVLHFDDGTSSVQTRIDRQANGNRSVRLVGGNRRIAEWFQQHFQPDDVVTARILGLNEIELVRTH